MAVKRKLVFEGTLRPDTINQSSPFYEGDLILLEVFGLAEDEFVDIAGSLNVRVRQGATLDPCDDLAREVFDMGDYEYPLDIPVFNSYTLVKIDYELSLCAFEMSVVLLPSFAIPCRVWVLWQEKNVRNLYRYVCGNEIKEDARWLALAGALLANSTAAAYSVSALATILSLPTGGTSIALASPVLSGLALASAGLSATFNIPSSPTSIPLPLP